jgi:hypothetical protein
LRTYHVYKRAFKKVIPFKNKVMPHLSRAVLPNQIPRISNYMEKRNGSEKIAASKRLPLRSLDPNSMNNSSKEDICHYSIHARSKQEKTRRMKENKGRMV